jgi:hypothetical protein
VKRAAAIRRTPRRWAALVLLATWSICGIWDVSHAAEHVFEHADSEHHATLHDERQAAHEVAVIAGAHGHAHPDENSAVSTTKSRFEPGSAFTNAAGSPSIPSLACSQQADRALSARASPGAFGPSGPRAPPLS